jgi:hypothetical protein
MNLLRNATSQIIRFGPFLDSTDGVTAETGLTIAQADMQLSKDGGAFAQKNTTGNATHDADGWYSTTLDTTDTATNGILLLQVNETGALPVWHEFYVVPQTSYDAFTTNGLNNIAATDVVSSGAITTSSGSVSSVTTVATTTTNTDMRGTDSALLAASINLTAGAVDNVTLVATTTTNTDMRGTDGANTTTPPTAAAITDAVWDEAQTGHTTAGTFGKYLDVEVSSVSGGGGLTQQNVRDAMKLTPTAGAPSSDSVDEHLDDILTDTGTTLPAQITGLNDVAATDIVSSGAITTSGGAVSTVTTTTTNTDMRGTDSAALASVCTETRLAELDAANIPGDVDNILTDTGTTLPASISALNDISVSDILTTQMTEAYAADGAAPTLAQAVLLIQQTIGDFAIAGTTITTKKLDGSTTAATYTLDDSASPTSRTRAT